MGGEDKVSGGSTIQNNIRSLLVDHIESNPGISFKVLRSAFKIPDGTLRYHLDHLMKTRKIVIEKKKNNRCYYPYLSTKFPHCVGKIKLNEDQEKILNLILEQPGIKREHIMKTVRLDRKATNSYLRKLRDHKLIWKVERNGIEGYEAITRDNIEGEMFRVIVKKFIDEDIDRDTFFELMKEFEKK